MDRRGFTLIEILVVMAIVAILAAVTVLALNPAEILRKSRDASRISDLSTLNNALVRYLSDVVSPDLDGGWNSTQGCSAHASSGVTGACNSGSPARFTTSSNWVASTSLAIDSTGWIPVDFTAISSGSPIPSLPKDPTNNTTYFYAYAVDKEALRYELNADMESTKYRNGGSGDLESADGGNDNNLYEVGTDSGLNL
jgi:prepilin-type N-terminal cleavage/methylation domain-containing protein